MWRAHHGAELFPRSPDAKEKAIFVPFGDHAHPGRSVSRHIKPRDHPVAALVPYDPSCYLCPGNVRAGGAVNPRYEATYAFTNDFPALEPAVAITDKLQHPLLISRAEWGQCRVICYSPRHDLHFSGLDEAAIVRVVDCWANESAQLTALPEIVAVTVFENRGSAMGASNPHPHGQIWAESSIPNELAKETASLKTFFEANRGCLLCSYAAVEIERNERIVFTNDHVLAVVPYWAVWPFEILVLPRRHCGTIEDSSVSEREALASALKMMAGGYDALFGPPFPYSMGFHQSPADEAHPEWHFHAHFYPPLRDAGLRKYMVGYEMLAQPQRDLTPEEAAARLRACNAF